MLTKTNGSSSPTMRVVRKEQRSKRERRKWVRKAPLISTASPVRHVDPASMDNKEVLMAKGKAGKDTVLGDVREGLLNFLNRAHLESWGPDEKYRRFYIFGDYITCACWEGKFWISGPDVFKAQCALYRLEHGSSVPLRRKFEECILTQLRKLEENAGMRIESSGSPFINHLYSIGAIRTRKRQKVFEWSRINHEELVRPKAPEKSQTSGKRDLKTGKSKDGYVIKSIRLYEKPGMAALMSAIDMVEVNDESQESEISFASI